MVITYIRKFKKRKIYMTNIIKTDGNSVVNVLLEVELIKEGDYIVSYCPALELSSFGVTEDDAKEGFEGILETFLKDTHEKGTLERVLLDLGWSLKKIPTVKYRPPIKKVRTQQRNSSYIRSFSESVAIPV
jgi:predicted RNase H-like HicB family nuclease